MVTKKNKRFIESRLHIYRKYLPDKETRILNYNKEMVEESEEEIKYYTELLKKESDKEIKKYFKLYLEIHKIELKINKEILKDFENGN